MSEDRGFALVAETRFMETIRLVEIGCDLYPGCPLAPGCRTYPLLRAEARSFELEAETRTFDLVAE